MTAFIGRREFITLLGGAASAWPLAVSAQQGERVRRIGVLMTTAADDSEGQARISAFLQGLQQLGWIDGRNAQIDARWSEGDADRARKYAAELVVLAPDVILATGSFSVGPLLQATRTVPIVFAYVPDPVGAGFVDSLARPGGIAQGDNPDILHHGRDLESDESSCSFGGARGSGCRAASRNTAGLN